MIEQGVPHGATNGHQPIETDVRAVCVTAAVLAGVVVASFLLVLVLLQSFAGSTGAAPASQFAVPDSDSLRAQLQSLRAREKAWLDQYQWIDSAAGVARIPIQRAMEIVSARGLSGIGDASPAPAENTSESSAPASSTNGEQP